MMNKRFEQKEAKKAKREQVSCLLPGSLYSRFHSPSLALRPSVQKFQIFGLPLIQNLLLLVFPLVSAAFAEVTPVSISLPKSEAWTGQRLPLYVDLRSPGSFSGATHFDLPDIPGTVIMTIGNAQVSSEEIEGEQWSIQRHEFALFSQRTGILKIPAFGVRFGTRDGFTGPSTPHDESVPSASAEIRRPPGSEDLGFLITTESLTITETWDPQPGPAKVGDIFKRSIVQRAPELSGMALAPAPATAPEGFRVYPPKAETHDKFERGDFLGERRETLTYLIRKPGTLILPALKYVWWDPKTETLESKILPAVTFEVVAPTVAPADAAEEFSWMGWCGLGLILIAASLGFWKRRECSRWWKRFAARVNPPDKIAARRLLAACGKNDASEAQKAWDVWRNCVGAEDFGRELNAALLDLQSGLFGRVSGGDWQGNRLAAAFRKEAGLRKARKQGKSGSPLPELNAGS